MLGHGPHVAVGADAGPGIAGAHQVGDDDVGPVKDGTARLFEVYTPSRRDQHVELAAQVVEKAANSGPGELAGSDHGNQSRHGVLAQVRR